MTRAVGLCPAELRRSGLELELDAGVAQWAVVCKLTARDGAGVASVGT